MMNEVLFDLLDVILVIARLTTATFLLAMGFYLQIIAETSVSPDADPIPWQFRILPAFLGFFILHTAGRITLYPLPREFAAAVLYFSLLAIVVKMFQFLLDAYGMKSPRDRVPEFICESVNVGRKKRTDDMSDDESRQRE